MEEQVYKTMKAAGILNMVLGIVTIVFAVAAGVLFIVSGARLLKKKSSLIF